MTERGNPERRALIKMCVLAGTAAAIIGIPVASYIVAPALKQGRGKWINFGAVANLRSGSMEPLSYNFMVKDGWLVRPQQGVVWAKTGDSGKLTIFSSACTHLGCSVNWLEAAKVFECPCHSASFDASGRPISGPPTKPLTVLEHKVKDGNLLVLLTA